MVLEPSCLLGSFHSFILRDEEVTDGSTRNNRHNPKVNAIGTRVLEMTAKAAANVLEAGHPLSAGTSRGVTRNARHQPAPRSGNWQDTPIRESDPQRRKPGVKRKYRQPCVRKPPFELSFADGQSSIARLSAR